jgi:hypothetical protein
MGFLAGVCTREPLRETAGVYFGRVRFEREGLAPITADRGAMDPTSQHRAMPHGQRGNRDELLALASTCSSDAHQKILTRSERSPRAIRSRPSLFQRRTTRPGNRNRRAACSMSRSRARPAATACTVRTSCGNEWRNRAGASRLPLRCALSRSRMAVAGCDSLRVGPLLLLGVGFLLREQVDPIVCIGRPMTAEGPRPVRHGHQHECAQSLDQALAGVRPVPAWRHVVRRGAMIEWMPICEQN